MTLDELIGGKIKMGGVEYNLVEIKHGGTGQVIWPATLTYVIDASTLVVHYPVIGNWIPAYGGTANYCYATANVNVKRGNDVINTIYNATLTPTSVSGTYASHFTIGQNSGIYGANLGTTEVNIGTAQNPQGYYCTASWVYTPQEGSASAPVTDTIYQQYNIIESTSVSSVTVYSTPAKSTAVATGETIRCSGSILRTLLYTWTSTSQSQGTDSEGTLYLYIDEEYKTTISSGGYFDFVIPENPYAQSIEFYVVVKYVPDQEVTATATITQAASVFTYDRPVIFGDCDMVPASGGTSYFVGYATQAYYRNGTRMLPDLQPSISWSVASYTGQNLHKTPTPETKLGSSTATCTANGQTAIPLTVDCHQEENKKTLDYYVDSRTDLDDEVESKNPSVSVSATNYTDSNSPCSAGGGTCTLQYTATADVRSRDRWRIDRTSYYTWTSGDPDEDVTTNYYNGEWSSWTSISVDPDIECNKTWSRVGYNDTVTIDSRGTDEDNNGRSVIYTASYTTTNGVTDSDTVTLYQQYNVKTEPHDPVRSLTITTSGTIPSSGGTFSADYVSQETYGLYVYTSGATSGTEQRRGVPGEITCTNCNYNGSTRFNVSGAGTLVFDVPANQSTSTRTASILLDDLVGDSIQQERIYTFALYKEGVPVSSGDTLTISGTSVVLSDSGSNLGQYTFTQNSGGSCTMSRVGSGFWIENMGTGFTGSFTISEASSGGSVTFTVERVAASISADVNRIGFLAAGGTEYFNISAVLTGWSITYNSHPTRPVINITPTSGSAGATQVEVVCAQWDLALAPNTGTITITPTDSSLSAITIDVYQASNA